MDARDHGSTAARVEVEDFHCPAAAGDQHQVWSVMERLTTVHRGGSPPTPHAGPASQCQGARGGGGETEDKGEAQAEHISGGKTRR